MVARLIRSWILNFKHSRKRGVCPKFSFQCVLIVFFVISCEKTVSENFDSVTIAFYERDGSLENAIEIAPNRFEFQANSSFELVYPSGHNFMNPHHVDVNVIFVKMSALTLASRLSMSEVVGCYDFSRDILPLRSDRFLSLTPLAPQANKDITKGACEAPRLSGFLALDRNQTKKLFCLVDHRLPFSRKQELIEECLVIGRSGGKIRH